MKLVSVASKVTNACLNKLTRSQYWIEKIKFNKKISFISSPCACWDWLVDICYWQWLRREVHMVLWREEAGSGQSQLAWRPTQRRRRRLHFHPVFKQKREFVNHLAWKLCRDEKFSLRSDSTNIKKITDHNMKVVNFRPLWVLQRPTFFNKSVWVCTISIMVAPKTKASTLYN